MTVRLRSLLFMPGDDAHKIEKGAGSQADAIIADLEDGVALSQKEAARGVIVESFNRAAFGSQQALIRINPVDGSLWQEDLQGTIGARPNGYVLPKVESAEQVRAVCHLLAELEKEAALTAGSIFVIALIESARGLLAAPEIAQADERLRALAFGAEDYASDVGAQRTQSGQEVLYARSRVVAAAGAFGLLAIDTVFVALQDVDNLTAEAALARQLGFRGKLAVHPRQVAAINQVFTPDAQEVAAARRLVQEFEAAQAAGRGAIQLDGKMVDMPMVRAARRVLAAADGG